MATISAPRPAGKSTRPRIVEHLARRLARIDRSHRPLLDAIAAAPDDDLPRLVYADWLEERGEAERAAFIRAQCRPGQPERPLYAGGVDQIVSDFFLESFPARNPIMLAARFLAIHSPPGCPVRLRWYLGRLWRLTDGRYSPADKSDLRNDLLRWLSQEVATIHKVEMRAWEDGGRRGRMPMQLKVTGRLLGQVFGEMVSHVYGMGVGTRRGEESSSPRTTPTDPDSWHFDLFGWDALLGVGRPAPVNRVSGMVIEPEPGTALPQGMSFDRGFVACGELQWPRLWTLEEVAATCARQPVTAVLLLYPGARAARRRGAGWVVRRGESRSQWRQTRPEPWFADGVLPAAAFDLLVGQSDWWNDVDRYEMEYRSLGEAELAVRWLETEVNAAIRLALSGELPADRSMTN